MRKRVAAAVALAVGGASEPASARLSASGDAPAPLHVIAAVGRTVTVYDAPDGRAVARVRKRTRFGSPTRLAVLHRRGDWLEISSEALGPARRGWIRHSEAVRLSHTAYQVTVDLSARRLELRHGHRVALSSAVAVGTAASPTPTGRFGVTDKLDGDRFDGVYGCCVLAVSTIQTKVPSEWQGGNRIALHGTNSPWSFGRAVSTGCVRVREAPLRELMRRVPLGTPVLIRR
jgi:hypothetical protein